MMNGSLLKQLGNPETPDKADRARLEFERGHKAVKSLGEHRGAERQARTTQLFLRS